MDAAYLHARYPADARIVFFDRDGVEAVSSWLPEDLRALAETTEIEILLPCEETSLRPLLADDLSRNGEGEERVVPALWHVPALALPLRAAIPFLEIGRAHV